MIDLKKNQVDPNALAYAQERSDVPLKGAWLGGNWNWSVTTFKKADDKFMSVFHVKPVYYVTKFGAVRPISEILEHHGNRRMTLKLGWEEMADYGYIAWLSKRCAIIGAGLMMPMSRVPLMVNTTLTAYPDPNPETTTVDGAVQFFNSAGRTWAQARGGIGTGNFQTGVADGYAEVDSDNNTNKWNWIRRAIEGFDTSSIGTDNIDDATLSLYGQSTQDNFSLSIGIVIPSPASNTNLVNSDYNIANWDMTAQNVTDIAVSAWSTSAYNDFTLNATGEGNINKTGVTNLGHVTDADRDNIEPTWTGTTTGSARAWNAEQTGTSQDPKLVVNHSAGGGGGPTGVMTLNRGWWGEQ